MLFIIHWEFPSRNHPVTYNSSYSVFRLFCKISQRKIHREAQHGSATSSKILLFQQAHIPINSTQISPKYQAVLNCQSAKSSSVFTSISCKIVIDIETGATAWFVLENWYMGVHFGFPSYPINQINHSRSYCVIYLSSHKE